MAWIELTRTKSKGDIMLNLDNIAGVVDQPGGPAAPGSAIKARILLLTTESDGHGEHETAIIDVEQTQWEVRERMNLAGVEIFGEAF